METTIKSTIKERVESYLLNDCCFNDFDFADASKFFCRDLTDAMILHLFKPTKSKLDDAIIRFSGNFKTIIIYF